MSGAGEGSIRISVWGSLKWGELCTAIVLVTVKIQSLQLPCGESPFMHFYKCFQTQPLFRICTLILNRHSAVYMLWRVSLECFQAAFFLNSWCGACVLYCNLKSSSYSWVISALPGAVELLLKLKGEFSPGSLAEVTVLPSPCVPNIVNICYKITFIKLL